MAEDCGEKSPALKISGAKFETWIIIKYIRVITTLPYELA